MKKILYAIILLFVSLSATAENYFTAGVNDTIRIHPIFLGQNVNIPIRAHFDGRVDYWHVTFGYPNGLSFHEAVRDSASMTINYVNQAGHDTVYNAQLTILGGGNTILSSITEYGYYPKGSLLDCYGTVKWEAGDYDPMFTLGVTVGNSFRSGWLSIDALMSSTHDWRGGTVGDGVYSYKSIYIYVGYMRGDVDANGYLTIADVTELINYLLYPDNSELDEFQIAACDANGDGAITIYDVTYLTNIVMGNGASLQFIEDLMEQLSGGSEM